MKVYKRWSIDGRCHQLLGWLFWR